MIMLNDRRLLYGEAIKVFGFNSQLDMVVEEAAELITAIQHYKRTNRQVNINNVIEEIVDVKIMLEQLEFMLDADFNQMDEIKEQKLSRLEELIREAKGTWTKERCI